MGAGDEDLRQELEDKRKELRQMEGVPDVMNEELTPVSEPPVVEKEYKPPVVEE